MSQFRNKSNSIEKNAKNKKEAIELALKELGVTMDDVDIEVLDEGSKGFLGIGARDARVKVTLKAVKEAVEAEVPKKKPAKVKEEKVVTPKKERTGDTASVAETFLSDIFSAMKLDVAITAKLEGDELSINLSGENMGIVIGKRGDTLDSLQYLTSLVINKDYEDYIKVTIDTENYREKREEALLALSKRLAEKVRKTGKRFTLEPMNPYERRIIHSNLQDCEDVTTYSIGTEPYRKVVIAPKNAKYNKGGYNKKRNSRPRKSNTQSDSTPRNDEIKTGGYAPTYKADFKPQQHKAEYKNFDEYLAGHSNDN